MDVHCVRKIGEFENGITANPIVGGPIENRWHQQGSGILDTGTSQAMDILDDVKHGPLYVDKTDQDFNNSTMTTTMRNYFRVQS